METCQYVQVSNRMSDEMEERDDDSSRLHNERGSTKKMDRTSQVTKPSSHAAAEVTSTNHQQLCQYSRDKTQDFILYKHRWVVLAIFSLISMTNEVIWISLSSITSIVKEYYGVSSIAVNWLSMVYMLFYVFVIVAAYVLDRQGLKFTIVIGAVLNGLGSCLRLIGANRDGFVFTFLGNASAALAQCFILFVPPTLAATWFGEHERATASAIGVLMNMLGVAIGFLMGGTMVPSSTDYDGVVRKGMFNTLIAQAVFCTFMVVCCVIIVKDAPKTPPSMSQYLVLKSKQQKNQKKAKIQFTKKGNVVGVSLEHENMIPEIAAPINTEKELHPGESNFQTGNGAPSKPEGVKAIGFSKSLKLLVRDKTFHLVTQAYGFYFGLFAAYNTILNQMCMVHYPGKEKEIGLMGFTSVLLGLVGIFFAGIWLDKTKKYKLISIATFACCTISLLLFTILLVYGGSFVAVYASFSVFGFFSYPYMTVGLEHAAEVTYPVSEGITSGILLLLGNMYGIILTYITGALTEKGRSDIAGYLMTGLYLIGLGTVVLMKGDLKRLQADHSKEEVKTTENVNTKVQNYS